MLVMFTKHHQILAWAQSQTSRVPKTDQMSRLFGTQVTNDTVQRSQIIAGGGHRGLACEGTEFAGLHIWCTDADIYVCDTKCGSASTRTQPVFQK